MNSENAHNETNSSAASSCLTNAGGESAQIHPAGASSHPGYLSSPIHTVNASAIRADVSELVRPNYLDPRMVWWTLDEAFAYGCSQGLVFKDKYSFRYALLAYKRKLNESISVPCRAAPYPRGLVQDFVAGRNPGKKGKTRNAVHAAPA